MDTTLTTSSMKKVAAAKPRQLSAARRAYLDTYARRRAGLPDASKSVAVEQAPQMNDVVVMPLHAPVVDTIQPVSPAQPVIHTEKIVPATQPHAVVSKSSAKQSVMTDFIPQVSQQVVSAVPQSPQITSVAAEQIAQPITYSRAVQSTPDPTLVTSHRSYLESLAERHIVATQQAATAEETVFDSSLQEETEELFEDIQSNQKLEANLRALYDDTSLTDQITKDPKSASAAHIRTIVASAFACGILAVGIFSFMTSYDSVPAVAQPIGAPVIEVEAPVQQPVGGNPIPATQSVAPEVNPDHPVRLVMSSIGVNAPVEGLGTTPDGLIAVPQAYGVVGWYNKGTVPGKDGPAVLVGHYTAGAGGVFDKLKDAKDGDLITVSNGRGESFTYKISKMVEYDKDKVPMTELFKKGDGSRLEIITCAGKWQANNYDKRLVVTAELVQ